MNDSQEADSPTSKKKDNPLTDIIVNVILPVLILSHCSKDGEKAWHLGPYVAMGLAIAIPLAYGGWHFIQHKKLTALICLALQLLLHTLMSMILIITLSNPNVGHNQSNIDHCRKVKSNSNI